MIGGVDMYEDVRIRIVNACHNPKFNLRTYAFYVGYLAGLKAAGGITSTQHEKLFLILQDRRVDDLVPGV